MAQNHDYEEVSNRTQNFTDTVFVSGGKVGIGHPTMRNTLEIGDVDNATDYQLAIENTQFGVVINSDGLGSGVDASPALLVQQDGSTAFRVNNNSYVGVGLDTPITQLTVSGFTSAHGIDAQHNGSTHVVKRTRDSDSGWQTTNRLVALQIDGSVSGATNNETAAGFGTAIEFTGQQVADQSVAMGIMGCVYEDVSSISTGYMFQTRHDGSGYSEKIRINSQGDIGVNTGSPESNLHIAVDNGVVGAALRRGVKVVNDAGTTGQLQIGTANDSYIGTSSESGFNINTYDTARIAIRSDGNVGIGTGTANGANNYKLNVAGTTRTQGDALFDENLTVMGSLSVRGDLTYLDTEVTVTSAIEITNEGTGPALIVNQTGAQPVIDVQDDGTSVFYVEDGGNVGIGITDPATKLHISGTDSLVIPVGTNAQRGSATQGGIRYNTEASTFEGYNGSAWGSLGGVMDGDSDTYITPEETSDDDHLRFYTAGTENMVIDDSGNVGIGTDEPEARLHVYNDQGSAGGRILLDCNVSSGYESSITQTDTGLEFTAKSNSRGFVFNTGSSPAARVTIDDDGYVGIGTTNPSNALHIGNGGLNISGTGAFSNDARINIDTGASTDHDFIKCVNDTGDRFIVSDDTTNGVRVGIGTGSPTATCHVSGDNRIDGVLHLYHDTEDEANSIHTNTDGDLEFRRNGHGNNQVSMTIKDGNGYVGIGDPDPDARLTVAGDISASGWIRAFDPDAWVQYGVNVNNLGGLTHHGSYRVSLVGNGYRRDSDNLWESYGANSQTGATIIDLDPTGKIFFGAESVKSTGADEAVISRMTLTEDGLGIGTTSPSCLLDVRGDSDTINAKIDGGLQVWNQGQSSRGYGFMTITNGEACVGGNLALDEDISGTTHDGYTKGTNARGGSIIRLGQSASGAGFFDFRTANDSGDDTYTVDSQLYIDGDTGTAVFRKPRGATDDVSGPRLTIIHNENYTDAVADGYDKDWSIDNNSGAFRIFTDAHDKLRLLSHVDGDFGNATDHSCTLAVGMLPSMTFEGAAPLQIGQGYQPGIVFQQTGPLDDESRAEMRHWSIRAIKPSTTNMGPVVGEEDRIRFQALSDSAFSGGANVIDIVRMKDLGGATLGSGELRDGTNYIDRMEWRDTSGIRAIMKTDGKLMTNSHIGIADGLNNAVWYIPGNRFTFMGAAANDGGDTTDVGYQSQGDLRSSWVFRADNTITASGYYWHQYTEGATYADAGRLCGNVGSSDFGDLTIGGDLIADGTTYSSDARLKENIAPLSGCLDTIVDLNPVEFTWIDTPHKRPDSRLQYGLIAQEVEEILPELVVEKGTLVPTPSGAAVEDIEKFKRIEYTKLIPILIGAVQDQQTQIEDLKQQIVDLQSSSDT